jgi:hypothetical protein
MTILIFLRLVVANVRRDVYIDRLALVGGHLRSVRDADDPDELRLDIPQSEALVHDQLPARGWHRDVNGHRLDACERRPWDFDLHAGGVVQCARDGRDGYAACV